MARFNLDDYETVEERIRKFYEAHPDGRIITENLTTPEDRSVSTWVVRASIYLTAGDQAADLPKASGLAFEIDGGAGANSTSALENAETSAIGRSLANGGWSGSRRASRSEMEKVERGRDWLAMAEQTLSVEALRLLYGQAKASGASKDILEKIKDYADALQEQNK